MTHPIEHRNMPLNDAVSFVARNFDSYLRDLREPPPPAQSYYSPSSYSHPAPPPRYEYDRGGSYRDLYSSSPYGSSSSAAAGYGYPDSWPAAAASREPSAYYADDRRNEERRRSEPPAEVAERTYSSEVLNSMIEKLKRDPGIISFYRNFIYRLKFKPVLFIFVI